MTLTSCKEFKHLTLPDRLDLSLCRWPIDNIQLHWNIDQSKPWDILLLKEAFAISRYKPFLNSGLKASKGLRLFE